VGSAADGGVGIGISIGIGIGIGIENVVVELRPLYVKVSKCIRKKSLQLHKRECSKVKRENQNRKMN